MSIKETKAILAAYDKRDEAVRKWAQEVARRGKSDCLVPPIGSTDDLQWDYDTCGSYQNSEWGE